MSERPLERLHYFDGRRLEAEDLRLEQEFHLRLQRWLSRSLFSPGVADGLDVLAIDNGNRVMVSPGLALDDHGRAIILVQPVQLIPQAQHLCVRYRERKDGFEEGGCTMRSPHGTTAARWEGQRRIVSEPEFVWRREVPLDETHELVIATLKLDVTGVVEAVESGPRLTAAPKPLAQVRALSLEGEKDIDHENPLVVTFHVRHRRPTAVTLHFSALDFSTLHYSEVGEITPRITGAGAGGVFETGVATMIDPHTHAAGALGADAEAPEHAHAVTSKVFAPNITVGGDGEVGIFAAIEGDAVIGHGFRFIPTPIGPVPIPIATTALVTPLGPAVNLAGAATSFSVTGGGHVHEVSGKTAGSVGDTQRLHEHSVGVTIEATGSVGAIDLRGGNQLTSFTGLEIKVNGVSCTARILAQVKAMNPAWGSITSFDGSPGHPLLLGTGPVRLDLIDMVSFDADEARPHTIEFSVRGAGNGGCVQYNLYVE